jgi:predicted PurR-regulated permease PerM
MFSKETRMSDAFTLAFAFALAIIAVEVVSAIAPAFLILFTAVILAIAMERPIAALEVRSIPRTASAVTLYASLFIGLVAVLSLVLPPLASEFRSFITSYPVYSEALLGDDTTLELKIMPYVLSLSESVAGTSESLISTIFRTFGGLTSFLAVFFVAFFLNVQTGGFRSFVYPFVPKQHLSSTTIFLDRIQERVSNWLWGKALSSLIVGAITLTGLLLLGIPYAFVLAVLALFLNFIPIIGPIIASVPAVILALAQSPLTAVSVAVFYFFVNGVLESFVFGPLLMKRAIHVSPAFLILFVVSGAYLGGIFGIIIAIPAAAIIYLAVCEYTGWNPSSGFSKSNKTKNEE